LTLEDYIKAGIPVVGLPIAREQFSESDDVGDAPKDIKAAWPAVDWSNFPDEPEVWWYPGSELPEEEIKKLTVQSQREKSLQEDWEEPWGQVLARAAELEVWLQNRPEKHICVVSHGGMIEALVGPRMTNAEHCILKI